MTPIHLDLTGRRLLRQLQDWDWDLEGATAKAAEHADPGAGGEGGAARRRAGPDRRRGGARPPLTDQGDGDAANGTGLPGSSSIVEMKASTSRLEPPYSATAPSSLARQHATT